MTERVELPGGTWTCHVCGRERPDHLISVFHREILVANGRTTVTEHVRYCNRELACVRGVQRVSFMRPRHQCEDCEMFAKDLASANAHCDTAGHSLARSCWSIV